MDAILEQGAHKLIDIGFAFPRSWIFLGYTPVS
jgi:hypothetical protein